MYLCSGRCALRCALLSTKIGVFWQDSLVWVRLKGIVDSSFLIVIMLRFLNHCLLLSLTFLLSSNILVLAEWDGDATLDWSFDSSRDGGRYEMMFFKKGDILTINWEGNGSHNVFRHQKDNCDVNGAREIAPTEDGGSFEYVFEEIGHHYLACDLGTFDEETNQFSHCATGRMYGML